MEENLSFRRTLDHFEPGQLFEHWPGKTVTESDNNLFCLLTMNHHPVHLDEEFARTQQHGRILVVGAYVLSLVVGMSVADISGAAIANLEYEKVIHHAPVFVGDTIRARTRVLEITGSRNKPDRGVVRVETEGFNQRDEKVISFTRKFLVPKVLREG